jgi:hypothetical protein
MTIIEIDITSKVIKLTVKSTHVNVSDVFLIQNNFFKFHFLIHR